MKKMMGLFAVALISVSAHAIQLNWAVPSTAVMRDSDGVALAGATVALIMADSTATTASQITYSWDGSNYSIGGGQLVTVSTLNASGYFTAPVGVLVGAGGNGTWGSSDYVGVDFLGSATSTTSQGTGSANTTRYYMIVFDGSYNSGTYAVASPAANTQVSLPTANGTVTFAVGGATGAASTWTAVPEPTSMALLALGAAAIGLRRKFRK